MSEQPTKTVQNDELWLTVTNGVIDILHKQHRLAVFGLNEMILLHVSLCPNLNTVYHFAFKLLCVKNIDPETTLGVRGA